MRKAMSVLIFSILTVAPFSDSVKVAEAAPGCLYCSGCGACRQQSNDGAVECLFENGCCFEWGFCFYG